MYEAKPLLIWMPVHPAVGDATSNSVDDDVLVDVLVEGNVVIAAVDVRNICEEVGIQGVDVQTKLLSYLGKNGQYA